MCGVSQTSSDQSDSDSEIRPTTASKQPITRADIVSTRSAEPIVSERQQPLARNLQAASARLRHLNGIEKAKAKKKKTLLRTVESANPSAADPKPLTHSSATRIALIHDRLERKRTKSVQTYTCEVCYTSVNDRKIFRKFLTTKNWQEHLVSRGHMKHLAQNANKDKRFFCRPCHREFQNEHDLNSHRNSAGHRRNLEKYIKSLK